MTRFTGAELPSVPRPAGPARRAGPALRHTRAPVARLILRILQSAFLRRLGHGMARLAEAGTAGYPPDVKRRLKILNLIAYLIAITTLIYALQQALVDFNDFAPDLVRSPNAQPRRLLPRQLGDASPVPF